MLLQVKFTSIKGNNSVHATGIPQNLQISYT
jgi:hypothetical protein